MVSIQKSIDCHPIDDNHKKDLGEGYYYCITITTNDEYDEGGIEWTEWYIHPNGTFSGATSSNTSFEPPVYITFGGTFEESKYNDYVEQMKEFKGEWEEELDYDETLYCDVNEKERSRRRCNKTIPSEVESSDLPF